MNMDKPAGVILTGGRSSRMDVDYKALVKLGGQTLLQRAIDRLGDHVDPLLLSCESENGVFAPFGLTVVPDLLPRYRGPLVGLYSALRFLEDGAYETGGQENGLVLCPCDAPFIPQNLVSKLLDARQGAKPPVVVVSYLGELQPTFSLWHRQHLPVIRDAVEKQGMGGLKQVLDLLPYKAVEWERAEPSPFCNVNSPGDLKAAESWLEHGSV